MGDQATIAAFEVFGKDRCRDPGRGAADQGRTMDVLIDCSEDILFCSDIFEDAFLNVFSILQRLLQSFRRLDPVRDGVRAFDCSLKLIQALADQSRGTGRGCLVAIKKSDPEARASENDGPSATDKADTDYCDFSRHVLQCEC